MTQGKQKSELNAVLKGLRRHFFVVGAFSFVINLLMLTPAIYMLQIYGRVISSRNETTLLVLTVIMVGTYLLMSSLEFIRSRVLVRVGNLMESKLDSRVFGATFFSALLGRRDNRQPLNDLSTLRQFLTSSAPFAFFDAPWSPIYIGVIFLLHPMIGWFAIGAALILFILAIINELLTRKPLQAANLGANQAMDYVGTSATNAEVIEALGMLPNIRERWQKKHRRHLFLQSVASDRAGSIASATRFIRVTVQSLILGLGAFLVIRNELTSGSMVAGSILLGRALAPIEQLIGGWRQFVGARSAHQRLNELLQKIPKPQQKLSLPAPKGHLKLDNATAIPPGGRIPVLKGINLDIPVGCVVGVIGQSGSGKSTLARLLIGVWPPYSGKVRLDGADISAWDKTELGPHLGYLPQDVELFEGSVSENICRFGETDPGKIVAAATRAGVHEMILHMANGYETEIGSGGTILSGGQRQRIALARALYNTPRLIVLDEPNSNLDDVGEAALVAAVMQAKQGGSTIIIITHRPSILNAVDRLLLLREGAVAAYGPREEVLAALRTSTQQARTAATPPPTVQ